eukprot:TRINITY_DN3135_c0_g1_i2.p1 TRINITY_DN3135_c0_g1~~TRINITY_DN3135_c0_g1_i2.p1  ORF type:complete len:553 (-),score=112.58 TRINITY_DN3135_c0_g1_i2:19-1677(-)
MGRGRSKRWDRAWRSFLHDADLITKTAVICCFLIIMVILGFIASHLLSWEPIVDDDPQITTIIDVPKRGVTPTIAVKTFIPPQPTETTEDINKRNKAIITKKRRDQVRQAFIHAYNGYTEHAFGFDELRPVTNETNSSWGAFGITIFDALDTMVLMNIEDLYTKSREWVLNVDFDTDKDASFFEFTIRYVGGLLGVYELTKDYAYIEKAAEMADRLIFAFNSSSGIPYGIVNLKTHKARNPSWSKSSSILSEYGSVQLEYRYLSKHIGNNIYEQKAQKVIEILDSLEKLDGLYPVYLDPDSLEFTNELVSYGGLGDSYYEYLLKSYLLSGKQDKRAYRMYLECINGLIKRLIAKSHPSGMTFIAEYNINRGILPEMDHLACYVPGMLALGAEGEHREQHLNLAIQLMDTCYKLYEDQVTGIGPERAVFNIDSNNDKLKDYKIASRRYLLRPETLESLFVLWRTTHNETYREWAWNIFESLDKFCKTPSSFSGLEDVTSTNPKWNNSMQSFFFAETLKYLFLIFSEDHVIPLDKYVFTTEAHPLGIFGASERH